ALVAAGWLARALGAFSAWQVRALLTARSQQPATPERSRALRRRALKIDAGFTVGIVLTQVVVWALSGGGYFWPEWVILPLALVLAIHGLVEAVLQKWPADAPVNRAVAIHGGVVAALFAFVTLIWTVTRPAPFWPGWVLLSLAIPLGIHA